MADFDVWVDSILKAEGGYSPTDSTAGSVNFGITERFMKENNIPGTPKDLTIDQAKQLYRDYFWYKYNIFKIQPQKLANLVGHLCVNCGPVVGIRMLQRALGVKVDGILGPITANAANTSDVETTCRKLKEIAASYYRKLASTGEHYAQYLSGWLKRLDRLV